MVYLGKEKGKERGLLDVFMACQLSQQPKINYLRQELLTGIKEYRFASVLYA